MAFLKTTWHHVRRSPYQAFAAIFIMLQTFFVVSIFTFVIFGSDKIINYFESLPQVIAFFKNEAKQESIDALKEQLIDTGKVSKVHFVSKQEALKIYEEKFKDDPLLLEFVTADILPSSLQISTEKIDDLSSISEALQKSSLVKEVVFPKDVITNLTDWTRALRKIGTALIVVLALDAIFIMVIITGIKISQRKEEIEIMRLLGATNWYIRWPFLFEGMMYGVVGAFFGWLFSVGLLWYSLPIITSFLRGIPLSLASPLLLAELLGTELLLAIFLGMFASSLAVLRYLK
ncbi:MAG: ABC transporter permease [Candidatus Levybacteria bacterium]|nr:ABC transporter permease [Candidatus Levybacteria bacterium]